MKEKLSTLLDVFVKENSKKIAEKILNKPFNADTLKEAVSYFKDNGLEFNMSSVIYSMERGVTEGFEFYYTEDQYKRRLILDNIKGVDLRLW
jgi:hypothetical protein